MTSVINGFKWKFLERFAVQGIMFIVEVILARLLSPNDYGILSLLMIFINIANIFIQSGFNTALIQNKDVSNEDFSSVFWVTLMIALGIYIVIFICAPIIGDYYNMPAITAPLRVIALMLIPGALNSVQLAKVSRELDFKKVFYSNVGGIIIGGICGILLAYMGYGLWSLVAQSVINTTVACIAMHSRIDWRPQFIINWIRIKTFFSFGWKLMVAGLLDTIYQELQSLVIGKKYDEETLGYCNRGKQFPQFLMLAINSTVQSVMLPVMSAKQNDCAKVKNLTRNSIMLSSYIVFPMMAGLAGIATPMVSLILTDKWLPCVPYMQIYCIAFAFYPVHSCNLQAINAVGRSDIFLKLEIAKKMVGVTALVISVFCFDSPIAIAMTSVLTMPIGFLINAYPNKKLIGYSYMEQIKDMIPSLLLSLSMFGVVMLIGKIHINQVLLLIIQIFAGAIYYVVLSAMFRLEPFKYILQMLKRYKKWNSRMTN